MTTSATTKASPKASPKAATKASPKASPKLPPTNAAPTNPAEKPVDPAGADESGLILPMGELGEDNPQSDGSHVANATLALASVTSYMDAGATWIPADAGATKALQDGAKAWMDLKSSILLGDGVTPDWAANSDAYSKAFQSRKRAYLLANNVDADRFDAYHNSLTTWISRNRYADIYIARWIVDHTVNLGAIEVGKKVKEGQTQPTIATVVKAAVKESAIPQPVRAEMDKHFSAQVSKPKADGTPGKRLNGFKVVPKQFGVKPPAAPPTSGAGNTGHQQPSGLWDKLILEVSRVAPLAAVNRTRELLTAISDAHLGEPGQKPKQPAVDKDGAIADRDSVIESYRLAASLLISTADVIEGMDGASKDNVATFRFVPEK